MLLQALHVEIQMKNLNLQVTLLVQKGVGTSFPRVPTPLHYTPAFKPIRFIQQLSKLSAAFCQCDPTNPNATIAKCDVPYEDN